MPARRGRRIGAVAASAAVHAVILAAIALHSPTLIIPEEPSGPPEPIIPVLLMPRTPPQDAAQKPTPIRLHRRPQRFAAPPIAPLPVPPVETAHAARPGPVITIHPAPLPEGPKSEVRTALRAGPVGCANPDAVGLTQAERDHCYEVLGKGAKTTTFVGLGLNRDKQQQLDTAGARREADYKYKHSPAPPPDPNAPMFSTAHDLAKATGNDKPDLKTPP